MLMTIKLSVFPEPCQLHICSPQEELTEVVYVIVEPVTCSPPRFCVASILNVEHSSPILFQSLGLGEKQGEGNSWW